MMMITTGAAVTAVFGLLVGSAYGDKDDSYYIAGTGNPNRDEKMYWKDAENIFQDLSQFQTLYVEFHNCAWTWMMMNDEDNDIDENDYWYMGKIPPMGANVAYSLYGSLYGETFNGCGDDTFINSFYTNSGFTNFARAMNYAGLSGFSSYSYDDDYSSSYTATCGGGYGVGCDYSNGFAVHTYSGDTCDPANYTGVSDKMSDFNSAIKAATCVQIYDANTYSGNPYGTPLELLAYSHSCFYQDFFSPDGVCPDPYGKLSYYQKQFYNGIQESKKQDPYQVSQRKEQYQKEVRNGKIMSLIGLGLAALAFVIFFYECLRFCCGFDKEDKMRAYTCRENDFIIKSRDEADVDNNQTVGDKSEISSKAGSEMYVTMSLPVEGTPYMPPVDVGLTTAASAPTPQGVPPAVHPPKEPEIVTPPPEVPLPPPPPPVVLAPEPLPPPTSPREDVPGVDMTPESPPPPEAVIPSPETVTAPTPVVHSKPAVPDPGAPITFTLYSPPCMQHVETNEKVDVASKDKELPPAPLQTNNEVPPSDPVSIPGKPREEEEEVPVETKLEINKNVEALDQQLAALADLGEGPVESKPGANDTLDALEQQLANLAEKLLEVKKMSSFDSSTKDEKTPSENLSGASTPKHQEEAPPLAKTPSLQGSSNVEQPTSQPAETPPSLQSPSDVENPTPLEEAKEEAKVADEDSIPSMDEIIASREQYSSDEEEAPQSERVTTESEEQSQGSPSVADAEVKQEEKEEVDQSSPSKDQDHQPADAKEDDAKEDGIPNAEADTNKGITIFPGTPVTKSKADTNEDVTTASGAEAEQSETPKRSSSWLGDGGTDGEADEHETPQKSNSWFGF